MIVYKYNKKIIFQLLFNIMSHELKATNRGNKTMPNEDKIK